MFLSKVPLGFSLSPRLVWPWLLQSSLGRVCHLGCPTQPSHGSRGENKQAQLVSWWKMPGKAQAFTHMVSREIPAGPRSPTSCQCLHLIPPFSKHPLGQQCSRKPATNNRVVSHQRFSGVSAPLFNSAIYLIRESFVWLSENRTCTLSVINTHKHSRAQINKTVMYIGKCVCII